jgi:hypothetical protein
MIKKFFKKTTKTVWCRNVELDDRGQLKPIEELRGKGGECFRAIYSDGVINFSEWYSGGKLKGLKFYSYDRQGRVSGISLIQKDKIIDTWHYVYGRSGNREYKFISYPGQQPHQVVKYPS